MSVRFHVQKRWAPGSRAAFLWPHWSRWSRHRSATAALEEAARHKRWWAKNDDLKRPIETRVWDTRLDKEVTL